MIERYVRDLCNQLGRWPWLAWLGAGICLSAVPAPGQALLEGPARYLGLGHIERVRFSPAGDLLAIAAGSGTLLRDGANLQPVGLLPGGAQRDLAFSADGRLLAISHRDSTIALWNVAAQERLAVLEGHPRWVAAMAFSADGRRLASGGIDGTVIVWDLATYAPLWTFTGEKVWALAFSPDGRLLAAGDVAGSVSLWDLDQGSQLATLPHGDDVRSLAFSPDGGLLASGSLDQRMRLWDLDTFQVRADFRTEGTVLPIHFTPDGQRLVFGVSTRQTYHVWVVDMETEEMVARFEDAVFALLAPVDSTLAFRGFRTEVWHWVDVYTLEERHVWEPPQRVGVLAPGGSVALALDGEGVRLWDWSSGALVGTLAANNAALDLVAYGPFGHWVATSSHSATTFVSLWNVETNSLEAVLQDEQAIEALLFTPEGDLLMVGRDYTRRWRLDAPRDVVVDEGEPLPEEVEPLWDEGRETPDILSDYLERTNRRPSASASTGALSRDGQLLALSYNVSRVQGTDGTGTGVVLLWDLVAEEPRMLLEGFADEVLGLAFHPQGHLLASIAASADEWIRLWDVDIGVQIDSLEVDRSPGNDLAFSPDGHLLALGPQVAFAPDSRSLAAIGGTLVWDWTQWQQTAFVDEQSGATMLWDAVEDRPLARFEDHGTWAADLAFSPKGDRLASVDQEGLLVLRGGRATAVVERRHGGSPGGLYLGQNYPNPFNSATVIPFALPKGQTVELAVYNLVGQRIARLIDGPRAAGTYTVQWDGRDQRGGPLASGFYMYRLQVGDRIETRKLLLLR